MLKRIICNAVLLATVFLGPWWLTATIGFLFVVLFKNYWEAFIAGAFMDALYYIPSDKLWGNFGIFTLSFLLLIIITEKIKKQIRI